MQKFITRNAGQTKSFAKKLAKDFKNGGIIALYGQLGAGKTTFTQGFAQGLGVLNKITSPTFLIIRQYSIPGQVNFFYHIDLYRLNNIDLKTSGLEEILNDLSNVVLIEWADKINESLPSQAKKISLKRVKEDIHEIVLTS
ncbi:tRNA (adenosine(37)-N6)-threonylcarbamoyltransferase complex ATPase subunit type 1 TsaE [Candidatus Daviesbacteria bacterium]|nr:tRNA (adenosine(37)-N6)-threonylcarbamoyltransferase complex ATPase subunit type 1 TsaE [Candidatus Daviesbacteria bacterium]